MKFTARTPLIYTLILTTATLGGGSVASSETSIHTHHPLTNLYFANTNPIVNPIVEPDPEPTPDPEPVPTPEPEPEPEPEPVPTPEPVPEPQPAPIQDPKPGPTPTPKPQPVPKPKPETRPTPLLPPKTVTDLEESNVETVEEEEILEEIEEFVVETAITLEDMMKIYNEHTSELKNMDEYIFENVASILVEGTSISEAKNIYNNNSNKDLAQKISFKQLDELEQVLTKGAVASTINTDNLVSKIGNIRKIKESLIIGND
ncbi:hypothetical protein [Bacillus sp. LL01]|uniref:hypothetical protein n=1 Tax=Bacillus sp. LL01 TaxID=1665556 RepID=UPI00069CE612|nr:hypothetical protein [Bacillus sp. LL01]